MLPLLARYRRGGIASQSLSRGRIPLDASARCEDCSAAEQSRLQVATARFYQPREHFFPIYPIRCQHRLRIDSRRCPYYSQLCREQ